MLLIIENNEGIRQYLPTENLFLDVNDLSLIETLKRLQEYDGITQIYFPLELKFQDTHRQTLQGLELFKHIRLTTELNGFQFLPILLGYSYPLETLLRNSENTLLCSPATHLFHLKNIHEIKHSPFFKSAEKLNREILKPYVLQNEIDEGKSEHDIRNEKGAEKLKREIENKTDSTFDLELWQKKIHFLQQETNLFSEEQKVTDEEFKKAIAGKKILYIDDEADKWENVLKQLFEGATLTTKSDYAAISNYIKAKEQEQVSLLDQYREADKEAQSKFAFSHFGAKNLSDFQEEKQKVKSILERLATVFDYDLVLLDFRLEKEADKTKPTNEVSGIKLLTEILQINKYVPVIMFTASNKIATNNEALRIGAVALWSKNISTASELKQVAFNCIKKSLPGQRDNKHLQNLYNKTLAIKHRHTYRSLAFDKTNKLVSIDTPMFQISQILDSIEPMLKFIEEAIKGNPNFRNLWMMTGNSIEARIPATKELSKGDWKAKQIDMKEFDYRQIFNYFKHGIDDLKEIKPFDLPYALNYIEHTIKFLLEYR